MRWLCDHNRLYEGISVGLDFMDDNDFFGDGVSVPRVLYETMVMAIDVGEETRDEELKDVAMDIDDLKLLDVEAGIALNSSGMVEADGV